MEYCDLGSDLWYRTWEIDIQSFSLIIQIDTSAQIVTSSSFTLLIAELSLHELRASVGVVADLLVGLCLFECSRSNALCVLLVRDCVFGVSCVACVSSLPAMKSTIATYL